MVTTPPSLIGVTHYYYAQVRNKEQRDKLIKLSGNLDYSIPNPTNKRGKNNKNIKKQGDYEWINTKLSGKRRNHKGESTKKWKREENSTRRGKKQLLLTLRGEQWYCSQLPHLSKITQ